MIKLVHHSIIPILLQESLIISSRRVSPRRMALIYSKQEKIRQHSNNNFFKTILILFKWAALLFCYLGETYYFKFYIYRVRLNRTSDIR